MNLEGKSYAECKQMLVDRAAGVVEMGEVLEHLKATKSYRVEYQTFERFLKAELGLSTSTAYRLIAACRAQTERPALPGQNRNVCPTVGQKQVKEAESSPPNEVIDAEFVKEAPKPAKPYLDRE